MNTQVQDGAGDILSGPVIPLVATLLAGIGYAGYNFYALNMANTSVPASASGWFFPGKEDAYAETPPSGLASASLNLLKAANTNVRFSAGGAASRGGSTGAFGAATAGPDSFSRQRAPWADASGRARKAPKTRGAAAVGWAQAKRLKLKVISLAGFGPTRIAPSSIGAFDQGGASGRSSWTAQNGAAARKVSSFARRVGGLKLSTGKDQLYMSHVQSQLSQMTGNAEESSLGASHAFETGSQAAASANVPMPPPAPEAKSQKLFLAW